MTVFVDADACPARNEILLVCQRHGIIPIFVANAPIPSLMESRRARVEVVPGAFDAADDWMIEHAAEGDLLLTADLLLAQRAVKKKAHAMSFSGELLSDAVIHDLVARREIQQYLREMSLPAHRPVPYDKKKRSRLKAALHEWIESRKRTS